MRGLFANFMSRATLLFISIILEEDWMHRLRSFALDLVPFAAIELARFNPIKLAYSPSRLDGLRH